MKTTYKIFIKFIIWLLPFITLGAFFVGIYAVNYPKSTVILSENYRLKNYNLVRGGKLESIDFNIDKPLNPTKAIVIGDSNIFTSTPSYSGIPFKVTDVIESIADPKYNSQSTLVGDDVYSAEKFIEEYKNQQLTKRLITITNKINNSNSDIGYNKWFSLKTPSIFKKLSDISKDIPVNSFNPVIAKFKASEKGIFKIDLKIKDDYGVKIPGGAKDISLYINNNNRQFMTNTVTQLINNNDIFIRDNDKQFVSNRIKKTNLFHFKKEKEYIEVSLMMLKNQRVDLRSQVLGDHQQKMKLATGYLNNDDNMGINTKINAHEEIGIYAVATVYDSLSKEVTFSISQGETSTVQLPIYYKGNLHNQKITISFLKGEPLKIKPDNFKIESGIMNPDNKSIIQKKNNPIMISNIINTNQTKALIKISFGNDANIIANKNKQIIGFHDLGVGPEEKVFFEKIFTGNPNKNLKQLGFVSFNDPTAVAKRFLARIFTQWIQIDGKYKKMLLGQSNKLGIGIYDINHDEYTNINISEKPVIQKNLTGVQLVQKIREEHKKMQDIISKVSGNIDDSKELFGNASNYSDVLTNMNTWLYMYDEDSKKYIEDLSTFIDDNKIDINFMSLSVHKEELIKRSEGILNILLQSKENNIVNYFKMIVLGTLYKYFGKALSMPAKENDKIIARNAFKKITVKVKNNNSDIFIDNVIKKNNMELVNIKDALSSSQDNILPKKEFYLKQVIDRILSIIKENNFTEFLVDNVKDFELQREKITDTTIYLPQHKNQQPNFYEAQSSFGVLRNLLEHFNISINNLLQYSTKKPSDFDEIVMLQMIKDKVLEFQEKFINLERVISFFGKKFKTSNLNTLINASNTKTTLLNRKLIAKKNNDLEDFNQSIDMLQKDLISDNSINSFALTLKKSNIKKYIEDFSNEPNKYIEKILTLDLATIEELFAKPLTPGYFGILLKKSTQILSSLFVISGLVLSVIFIFLICSIKKQKEYSYFKTSFSNLLDQKPSLIYRNNKILKFVFSGFLVISVVLFLLGVFIFSGVITPLLFIF